MHTTTPPNGLDQMALPHTGMAHQQQACPHAGQSPPSPVAPSRPVDGRRVKLPVEAFERLVFSECASRILRWMRRSRFCST